MNNICFIKAEYNIVCIYTYKGWLDLSLHTVWVPSKLTFLNLICIISINYIDYVN